MPRGCIARVSTSRPQDKVGSAFQHLGSQCCESKLEDLQMKFTELFEPQEAMMKALELVYSY